MDNMRAVESDRAGNNYLAAHRSSSHSRRVSRAPTIIGTPLYEMNQTLKDADALSLFQSPPSLRGIELGSFRSLETRLRIQWLR